MLSALPAFPEINVYFLGISAFFSYLIIWGKEYRSL